MNIVYFKGFQIESRPSIFNKIKILEKFIYKEDNLLPIEIDYYNNLEESIQKIKECISKENNKLIFIGISLGSFFAYYFSKLYSSPALLINPCYNPSVQLSKYIGERVGTEKLGYSIFTEDQLKKFIKFQNDLKNISHDFPRFEKIVVNKDDETTKFSSKEDLEDLRSFIPDGELVCYETGGHVASNFEDILKDVFLPLRREFEEFGIDKYLDHLEC